VRTEKSLAGATQLHFQPIGLLDRNRQTFSFSNSHEEVKEVIHGRAPEQLNGGCFSVMVSWLLYKELRQLRIFC
jgi:hypothetical protein